MAQEIQRKVDRAVGRVAQLVRRSIVRTVKADGIGQVEGFDGEAFDNTEFWEHFGITSRPPDGTEAIVLLIDADGDKAVVVSTHNRSARPGSLAVGDSVLFGNKLGDDSQAMAHAKATGDLDLTPGTAKFATLGGAAASGEFTMKASAFTTLNNAAIAALLADITTLMGAGVPTATTPVGALTSGAATYTTTKGKVI